ncbi:MAG: hypothetical protein E6R05_06950 [Candidatus Moraniibacteriota bacterium]|nr:MAG: hypothetical protein E6R05_06950 [Candidatus Moranbacteria bacterium]
MNTTRYFRFIAGLLTAVIIALTGGCAGSPRMAVPYDRPYQYDYWHLHAGVGYGSRAVAGGCTTTRYDSAIRFIVAVPCAPSVNGSAISGAGLERSRYSLTQLQPKLAETQMINSRHCAYAASPDQRWPSYECQKVVNELTFLEREITKEERATGAQCQYIERGGIQSRECSELVTGPWRKK